MVGRAAKMMAAMEVTAAKALTQEWHQRSEEMRAAMAATAEMVGRTETAGRVEMCVTKKIIIISVIKVLYNTILCHIALMCMVLIGV